MKEHREFQRCHRATLVFYACITSRTVSAGSFVRSNRHTHLPDEIDVSLNAPYIAIVTDTQNVAYSATRLQEVNWNDNVTSCY